MYLIPTPIIQQAAQGAKEDSGADEHCNAVDCCRSFKNRIGKVFEILCFFVLAVVMHDLCQISGLFAIRNRSYLDQRLTDRPYTSINAHKLIHKLRASGVIRNDLRH